MRDRDDKLKEENEEWIWSKYIINMIILSNNK